MLDIKYMSGLFDGEGCICLVKQKRNNSPLPIYSVRLVISMTHKPIIKAIQAQFGGIYTERKQKSTKERNSFTIQWVGQNATRMLMTLIPNLILKREEAEIALYFQQNLRQMGTSFWRKASKEDIDVLQAERELVRAKLSALKRVNHSVKWDDGEFGEHPMPGLEKDAEGQPRAKQTRLKLVGRV